MKENDVSSGKDTSPQAKQVINIFHKMYYGIHMLWEISRFSFCLYFSPFILNNVYSKCLFKQYFVYLEFVSNDMDSVL